MSDKVSRIVQDLVRLAEVVTAMGGLDIALGEAVNLLLVDWRVRLLKGHWRRHGQAIEVDGNHVEGKIAPCGQAYIRGVWAILGDLSSRWSSQKGSSHQPGQYSRPRLLIET